MRRRRFAAVVLAAMLGGCALLPGAAPGLLDITERPAERSLLDGIRAYEDARYPAAETLLTQALQTGLASPRDRAAAHKHLAFIFCTSARLAECEAAFRAARAAAPGFALGAAETGHPLWGPVYRRLQR